MADSASTETSAETAGSAMTEAGSDGPSATGCAPATGASVPETESASTTGASATEVSAIGIASVAVASDISGSDATASSAPAAASASTDASAEASVGPPR